MVTPSCVAPAGAATAVIMSAIPAARPAPCLVHRPVVMAPQHGGCGSRGPQASISGWSAARYPRPRDPDGDADAHAGARTRAHRRGRPRPVRALRQEGRHRAGVRDRRGDRRPVREEVGPDARPVSLPDLPDVQGAQRSRLDAPLTGAPVRQIAVAWRGWYSIMSTPPGSTMVITVPKPWFSGSPWNSMPLARSTARSCSGSEV